VGISGSPASVTGGCYAVMNIADVDEGLLPTHLRPSEAAG
jgi:hypothetical protein